LTLLSSNFPTGPLILDASVLFNVLGSGVAEDILRAIDVPCLVEERTAAEVRRMPGERVESSPLSPLFDAGYLQLHRMSAEAYETYLSLVSGLPTETLDDGESAAIALSTGGLGAVVLDDKKARRILSSRFAGVASATSLSFMVEAARRAGWGEQKLRGAITLARTVSRMAVLHHERAMYEQLFAQSMPI
jgi:predicted nucleic acid-binding protein